MISTKDFLESNAFSLLPNVIKNHQWFKDNQEIKKVFPLIGLENYVAKDYMEINGVNHDLVFSSSGVQGLWDIATMSMRGVLSCMHWNNHHSSHLIGCLVDPCTAIIYLTDNTETEYGKSIIKRCVVKYIIRNQKPALFIERVYTKTQNTDPYVYANKEPEYEIYLAAFKRYLQSKTKLPVIIKSEVGYSDRIYVPIHRSLVWFCGNDMPGSDAGVPYSNDPYYIGSSSEDFFKNINL